MTTTTAEPDTLADVVHALGDIPLDRILWRPFPGTATEADQLRVVNGEPKRLVELLDGILVEKAKGNREALFAISLGSILHGFVRPRKLGVVGAPDAIMRMRAGRNRLPDLYFTPWRLIPSASAHLQPVAHYPADLAVEILSGGSTLQVIEEKRQELFASGTRVMWIFDPEARTVAVYTDPDHHTTFSAADTLTGDPVLPGFVLPLAELFDDPQLHPHV